MGKGRKVGYFVAGWVAVGVFWFTVTRNYHPTQRLAVIVTATLIAAYAGASFINQFVLVPRLWRGGFRRTHVAALIPVMICLTALALVVIRSCYISMVGPDPDPNGLCKHFAIDFFGMVAHVLGAALIWRIATRCTAQAQVVKRKS